MQPASTSVVAGQTASLSVTASGDDPLLYQWRKNGVDIRGATSASYTTPTTASSDNNAQFSVVVSNSAGSVTSSVATLTVRDSADSIPPAINFQFNDGGVPTSLETLKKSWGSPTIASTSLTLGRTQVISTYKKPNTGFQVSVDRIDYSSATDPDVWEWKLWLENVGGSHGDDIGSTVQDQTLRFDFNYAKNRRPTVPHASSAPETWNGALFQGVGDGVNRPDNIAGFLAVNGEKTAVTLQLDGFSGGNSIASESGVIQDVLRDYLVTHSSGGKVTLGGLVPYASYNLNLIGSNNGQGTGATFRVGSSSASTSGRPATGWAQKMNYASLVGVRADGRGRISVGVTPRTGAAEAVINGLMLERVAQQVRGTTTPVLSNLSVANLNLTKNSGEFVLYYNRGCYAQSNDFEPLQQILAPNQTFVVDSNDGLSSGKFLPFLNIARSDNSGGTIVAVGWTGGWKVTLARNAGNGLNVKVGMGDFQRAGVTYPAFNAKLLPGEMVRTPGVIVMNYSGDYRSGQNRFRRFLRSYASPAAIGDPSNPAFLPITAGPYAVYNNHNDPSDTNMPPLINNIDQKGFPVNTWWVDAGWFADGGWPLFDPSNPANDGRFFNGRGVGTWRPDASRYTNASLASLARVVQIADLKFLLWFEPERALDFRGTTGPAGNATETDVVRYVESNSATVPNFLLAPATDINSSYGTPNPATYRLLDLGEPHAAAWVKKTIHRAIMDWKIDIYRQDFNMHPIGYWHNGEAPDRVGVRELKHITALYDFWDSLLHEKPELLIDNCASGGRRIDYESMRRSLVLTRTDGNATQWWDPEIIQKKSFGLSDWLPFHGAGVASVAGYDINDSQQLK